MKRSEMLDKMVEDAEFWQDSLAKFGGGLRAMLHYVLQEQEKVGMLPPFNNRDFYMDGDNAGIKSITYRTWEPEDES